jgi:hypothetical protein
MTATWTPDGGNGYGSVGMTAQNDPSYPATAIRIGAQQIWMRNPNGGPSLTFTNSPDCPLSNMFCGIGGPQIDFRDEGPAFPSGSTIWLYLTYGPTIGMHTRSSLRKPAVGPALSAGETHYCPVMSLVLNDTSQISLLLSLVGDEVEFKNFAYMPICGPDYPAYDEPAPPSPGNPQSIDLSKFLPDDVIDIDISYDPEICAAGAGQAQVGIAFIGDMIWMVYASDGHLGDAQLTARHRLNGLRIYQYTWVDPVNIKTAPHPYIYLYFGLQLNFYTVANGG